MATLQMKREKMHCPVGKGTLHAIGGYTMLNVEDCVVGSVTVGIGYLMTAAIIRDAMTMIFAVT